MTPVPIERDSAHLVTLFPTDSRKRPTSLPGPFWDRHAPRPRSRPKTGATASELPLPMRLREHKGVRGDT
ncbi:hypothetical protein GCM10009612_51870 [Streptomyces beijiangensis]